MTPDEEAQTKKHFLRLERLKQGELTPDELADMLVQKRVSWMKEHLDEMLVKYDGLLPEEQAYNIVYFDHMKIDPSTVFMERLSQTKIRIESHNFCPYLEASNQLELDTRVICKEVGEPSIQQMVILIHPNLIFSRNYSNLRPYHDFCEEFIELNF